MESVEKTKRHAGGRPKKPVRKDQQLAVMCNRVERKIIEAKAKNAGLSISEFLRTLALKGQVDRRIKTLPKEILLFTATLNHLAANLNQIAKKRNREIDLDPMERAELNILSGEVKALAASIKNYLR